MTGIDISRLFDQAIDSAYTGYFDNVKKQRFLDRAYIQVAESKYSVDDNQKTRDELSFIVSTNAVFSLNANQIYGTPLQISAFTIVSTAGTVTTVLPHNLITGQSVTISDVAGFTANPSGVFTVTVTGLNAFTITVNATTGAYTPGTGKIVYDNMISDYWHLLAVKAKYSRQIYDFVIASVTGNGVPIKVTMDFYNNISTGEQITFSGALGNTAINGTWYVKKLNDLVIALYQDEFFQAPVTGNGTYTSGAIMTRSWYNQAKPYESDVKIGLLNLPSIDNPKYEIASQLIKIYPLTYPCSEITVDYVRKPVVELDITDNITDLELYYPKLFLDEITAEMQRQGTAAMRDLEGFQLSSQQKAEEQ
jgi:hypothetical protein